MWTEFVVIVSLLAYIVESTAAPPKRFSIPARRLPRELNRRDGIEAGATEHVVVDFTFGGQTIPVSLDSGSSFTVGDVQGAKTS